MASTAPNQPAEASQEVTLPEIRFLSPAELDSLKAKAEELKKKFDENVRAKTP
jgi:hypothetical protein